VGVSVLGGREKKEADGGREGGAVRKFSCAYLHKEARKSFYSLDRGKVLVHPPATLKKDIEIAATRRA
jgi:hypothetical protein